jgi:hypothetical protein
MEYWICPFAKGGKLKSIDELPQHESLVGFVYKITNTLTGKFYIGKKDFFHSRKSKISKREKLNTGTRKTFKRTIKESDWLSYYGSSKDLKDDVLKFGSQNFKREILEVCCTKKYLSYCEVKHQFLNDVLSSSSYNGNILGKFYPRDLENCK